MPRETQQQMLCLRLASCFNILPFPFKSHQRHSLSSFLVVVVVVSLIGIVADYNQIATASASASKVPDCQNVIKIADLSVGNAPLHFHNVQLLAYDAQKRPACDEAGQVAIHVPGWLQLLSGEVHVHRPLRDNIGSTDNNSKNNTSSSNHLELAFTLEQDSIWVGRICEAGASQSAFLSDDFCTLAFCELLPAACQTLAGAQPGDVFPLAAFWPTAGDQWLVLDPPVVHPLLDGHWQAEAELINVHDGRRETLARIGIEDGWHLVKTGGGGEDEERSEL